MSGPCHGGHDDLTSPSLEAEGAWSERDVEDWKFARREAWMRWSSEPMNEREILASEGTGWNGDLAEIRLWDDPCGR
jgi:hypothetical protein